MKLKDLQTKSKHKAVVSEVYRNFVGAMEHDHRAEYKKHVKESDNAFLGEVFDEDQIKTLEEQGIPICKTNKGAVNSIRYASILTASRPEISCTPIGGADAGLSRLLKRDFSKVQRANHANRKYFGNVLDCVKEGLGWIEIYPQRYNGLQNRTVIEKCPPEMVYIDPGTKDESLDDLGFKIKGKKITEQYATDVHGLKSSELRWTPSADDIGVPEHQGTKTIDSEAGGRYDDVKDGSRDDEMNRLKEFARDIWEIAYYQPLKRQEKRWYRFVNGEIQEATEKPEEMEGEIPYQEVDVMYEDLLYVFVVGKKLVSWRLNPWEKDHNGKPIDNLIPLPNIPVKKAYPRGNLFFAIPALQELSKRRGQSISIVAATSGSPILSPKGAIQNIAEAEKKMAQSRRIIEYEGTPDQKPGPMYPAAPDISRVFELENRAQKDADDAWQLNPALKGEAETSKMSGKLNLLLKEAGLEGSAYFMVTLEEFFRKIAVCVIAMQLKNNMPD